MKLNSIKPIEGSIEQPTGNHHYCSDSPEDHQHLLLNASDLHSMWGWDNLKEGTYTELASLIDGNFLNQRIRASALEGVIFGGVEEDTIIFRVKSSKYATNRIIYRCMVKFDQWDEVGQDAELNNNEKARMLLWTSNIRIHCSDPSWLYYYQWVATQYDAAVYPEERRPVKMNAGETGICCKHLNRVLRVLPFHSGNIAKAMKAQFG
jgi:hypothetical protein